MKVFANFSAVALVAAMSVATAFAQEAKHGEHGTDGIAVAQTGSAPAGHQGDAVEMTDGEVTKVDKEAGKITLRHGELKNLGMGAMTMVFRVKDPAMLTQVKTGDKVKFVAERLNGAFTVVQLVPPK